MLSILSRYSRSKLPLFVFFHKDNDTTGMLTGAGTGVITSYWTWLNSESTRRLTNMLAKLCFGEKGYIIHNVTIRHILQHCDNTVITADVW